MANFTGIQNNINSGNVEIDGLNLYVSGTITFNATESGIGGDNLVHLIPGPGIEISSGSQGYAITASGGGSTPDLHTVLGAGNWSSQSINLSFNPSFINSVSSSASIVIGPGSNTSSGNFNFIVGQNSKALATQNVVLGSLNNATANWAFVQGLGLTGSGQYSHTIGGFNNPIPSSSAFVVGTGVTFADRKNGLEIYPSASQDGFGIFTSTTIVSMPSLPTSPTNLPAGALWRDVSSGNVIRVVP
jgi:hypothetical protein